METQQTVSPFVRVHFHALDHIWINLQGVRPALAQIENHFQTTPGRHALFLEAANLSIQSAENLSRFANNVGRYPGLIFSLMNQAADQQPTVEQVKARIAEIDGCFEDKTKGIDEVVTQGWIPWDRVQELMRSKGTDSIRSRHNFRYFHEGHSQQVNRLVHERSGQNNASILAVNTDWDANDLASAITKYRPYMALMDLDASDRDGENRITLGRIMDTFLGNDDPLGLAIEMGTMHRHTLYEPLKQQYAFDPRVAFSISPEVEGVSDQFLSQSLTDTSDLYIARRIFAMRFVNRLTSYAREERQLGAFGARWEQMYQQVVRATNTLTYEEIEAMCKEKRFPRSLIDYVIHGN